MAGDSSYLDPYRDAIKLYGPGFDALLWRNKHAQQTRFAVLDAMGDLAGKVVADLGCGDGGLAFWLDAQKRMPKRYIGVDGIDELVAASRRRAAEAKVVDTLFVTHDFVGQEDLAAQLVRDAGVEVFVLSGSLNTLTMEDAQRVLGCFFDALVDAGRGRMVFNFLSLRHNEEQTPADPPAVRFDPVAMFDWALGRTPMVDVRHAYLDGHDATIVMEVVGA